MQLTNITNMLKLQSNNKSVIRVQEDVERELHSHSYYLVITTRCL